MKKRKIKEALIFILFLFLSIPAFSQKPKPVYFLADTININKDQQIFEIGSEGPWTYYNFLFGSIPNYDQETMFFYPTKQDARNVLTGKPSFLYLSWKELSKLIVQDGKDFDKKYTLNIVEVLPNNKFKINKVKLFTKGQRY